MTQALTYFQRVAIEGEIATVLLKSAHNDEVLSRIYVILKHVPEEYREAAIETINEIVELPETDIMRVFLAASDNKYPVWLWVNRAMSDIKLALMGPLSESSPRIKVNRTGAKERMVTSAFAFFIRQACVISKTATLSLCERLLNEGSEFDFLRPLICMITEELKDVKTDETVSESLGDISFDLNIILSAKKELDIMTQLNEQESENEADDTVTIKAIKIESPIDLKAIAEKINKEILKLESDVEEIDESPIKEEVKYLVQKKFTGSNRATTLKAFDTEEEALKFVENIKNKFPELTNTCEFEVTKSIKK